MFNTTTYEYDQVDELMEELFEGEHGKGCQCKSCRSKKIGKGHKKGCQCQSVSIKRN